MDYVSTRGSAPRAGFSDVLLGGLAPDGGLYLPDWFPVLETAPTESYAETAFRVTRPFVDIPDDDWGSLLESVYERFDFEEVAPLRDLGDGRHLLELFWGPTYAFKDMAMQVLGDLFEYELRRRGETMTVIGATSGDTGAAAIDALKGRDGIELFMLHPHGGVSDVQRRQMTSCTAPNVHNLAIEGTFDDCQDAVKAMFADGDFRSTHRLGAVNSINWARVMMQVVYYVEALSRLGEPAAFAVPTGNFGNVYAGHVARRMGAPITGLLVASNSNDILTRFHTEAVMEMRGVVKTTSPSMDIQVSSNFERFVFEVLGPERTRQFMSDFRRDGRVTDPDVVGAYRNEFDAASLTDEDAAAVIRATFEDTGVLVDPHTAVGLGAAADISRPVIALATAHPAKFPDAIEAAIGDQPPVPDRLAAVLKAPEHYEVLPADLETIKDVVAAGRQEN